MHSVERQYSFMEAQIQERNCKTTHTISTPGEQLWVWAGNLSEDTSRTKHKWIKQLLCVIMPKENNRNEFLKFEPKLRRMCKTKQ